MLAVGLDGELFSIGGDGFHHAIRLAIDNLCNGWIVDIEQMSSPAYAPRMAKDLNIRVDGDEALVLFELLSRWSEDESAAKPPASCFASPAEVAALLSVLAQLERELVEPLQANYDELLASARERLVSKAGPGFSS